MYHLHRQYLITALAILLWLPGFSQIKPHPDGFIVTRTFMELTASRFDSLKHYKVVLKETETILDSCYSTLNKYQRLNMMQDRRLQTMELEISGYKQIIESYNRDAIVHKEIQKKLVKETRRKKTWKLIGIGAGTGFLAALILLAI